MDAGEVVAMFRNEVMDTEMPYLWTDDEAMVYLNDAYTMFVRFMEGAPDSITSACCTVGYSAADTSVDIHPAVLRIVRGFNDNGDELSVVENTDAPLVRNSAGRVSLLRVGSETGAEVQYLVLGADPYKARIHPVPTAGGSLTLQVRRLPLSAITATDDTLDDIPAAHHIHLVKWMKSLAYRKQDSDTFDANKADSNENAFLHYVNQSVFELSRLRRKTKESLRSSQNAVNPMLSASKSRMYESAGPSDPGVGSQRAEK